MIKLIPTLFSFLLLLIVFPLASQSEICDEPFVYYYGEGADYDARTLLAQDSFLYLGGQRGNQAFLAKLTTSGTLLWAQALQPIPDLPNAIVDLKIASDGSLIGCGQGRLGASIESFAFKLNASNGAPIWTQAYADPNTDYFAVTDIHENPANSNTYTLLGTALNNTALETGCDVAFYSIEQNSGAIASERIHFHLGSCDDVASSVIIGNNFYSTGRYNFANAGFNRMRPAVTSFTSNGTLLWSRLYLVDINQDARLYGEDIEVDGPNNLIVLARGDDDGVASSNPDLWIYRTDLIGRSQWAAKYTFPENIDSREIVVVENGYLIVANARNAERSYVMRVNGVGTLIWTKRLDNIRVDNTGDKLIVIGEQAYLVGEHIGEANNSAALLRFDIATGELPNDCIPNVDIEPIVDLQGAPYDGFNALSPYNTPVTGVGNFTLSEEDFVALPTSCGPVCGPEICDNGIDDDDDGFVDCDDPDLADDCCCYVPPVLDLGDDLSFCVNETILLDAGEGFDGYRWSDGSDQQTISVSNGGVFSVTVTDQCLNQQADTILVTALPTFSSVQDTSICTGETVDIFGIPETTAGTYSMTFVSSNGCDSTHTINLLVLESAATSEIRNLCSGEGTDIFGQTITNSGVFTANLQAVNGCDSVHTITVNVQEVFSTSEERSICTGSSTDIFGQQISAPGSYNMAFTSSNGCDSTHTINLSVFDELTTSEERSICPGESSDIFGQAENQAGAYSMTFTASNGCDSVHTITLNTLDAPMTSEDRTICQGESSDIFGQAISIAGTYNMTFPTSNGCDSTHTINLSVLASPTTSENIDGLCAGTSIDVFGETVTENGTFQASFTAANGCDSVHTIIVSFQEPIATEETFTICPDETIDIFEEMVTEPGIYTQVYTASNGCDSTYTINLETEVFSGSAYIFPPCPLNPEGYIAYISTQGNGGPYTVTYQGEGTYSNTLHGLQPGDHTAQVTSANGCEYTVDFFVRDRTQPWYPLVSAPTTGEPNGGSIQITTDDHFGPITYSLDGETFHPEPLFRGLSEGNYTLHINYGDVCSYTSTIQVPAPTLPQPKVVEEEVEDPAFAETTTASIAWQLSPNPARQYIQLQRADTELPQEVRLIQLSGEEVYHWPAPESASLPLPTQLINGIYIVQVVAQDGQITHIKLVIER